MSIDLLLGEGEPVQVNDRDVMISRRNALAMFGVLAASLSTPAWAAQEAPRMVDEFWIRPRKLRLQHVGGERLETVYWSDGQIVRAGWEEASWFMRDRREHKAIYMQPVLLDILYGICGWLDYYRVPGWLLLTSGYRTWQRNLRIEGAALDSKHPLGGAGDLSHPSVSARQMSRFGAWLGGGGVGWYPNKNFTHVDNGTLRAWRG